MAEIAFWIIFALCMGTAFVLTRYIKKAEDYYVMGHRGTTIGLAGLLTASYLSAVTFIGIAGIQYLNGPPIFLVCYGSWLGMVIGFLYVGRRLRAYNAMTMPDFIQGRFGSKVRLLATVVLIVGLLGYGIVQMMGAGVLLAAVTGFNYQMAIIIFAVMTIGFCAMAGMYSVLVVNTILLVTILIAMFVASPIFLAQGGGLHGVSAGLFAIDPNFWSAGGKVFHKPMGWTLGQLILWLLFFPAAPWISGMALPAKNDFVVMRAVMLAIFITAVGIVIVFLAVSAVYLINPNIKPADQVFIWASKNLINPVLGGFALSGVLAAILSTAATLFLGAGFGLSRDLYERYLEGKGKSLTEKQKLTYARIGQLTVGVIAAVFALTKPLAVYWIGAWAGALFATAWMPMLVAGFEWKRATRQGVVASIVIGAGSYIFLYQMVNVVKAFKLPFSLDPVIFAIIISCAALWIVSLMTKPVESDMKVQEEMKALVLAKRTMESLTPAELKKEISSTKSLAWGVMVVAVVILGWFMIEIIPKVSRF